MIIVVLPAHLKTLARVTGDVHLDVAGDAAGKVTLRAVLDTLEEKHPMLSGTIRDHLTRERRPFLRFFACEQDLTHEGQDVALPDAVLAGKEPLFIIGAIAGG